MNKEEIWKDILGYEGFYQVSNLGRVRSVDRIVKGSFGSQMKYVPTGVWRLDQRLNAALRRMPQYTQKVLCAVEAKQMELKRIRLHRLLEWVKAKQSVKEGNSNENVSSSFDGKMECL